MQEGSMAMGTMAEFTGILIRRHYRPGHKYVQLVFQTKEGVRLSLSRNMQLVRSLIPGKTYAVEGAERTLDGKPYIHEPTATLVQPVQPFMLRHVRMLAIGVSVMILAATASVAALAKHHTTPVAVRPASPAVATDISTDDQQTSGEVQGASTAVDTTNTPTTPTPPATTPITKKTTTAKVASTTSNNSPATSTPPAPSSNTAPSSTDDTTPPPVDTTPPVDQTPPADDTTPPPADDTQPPPSSDDTTPPANP